MWIAGGKQENSGSECLSRDVSDDWHFAQVRTRDRGVQAEGEGAWAVGPGLGGPVRASGRKKMAGGRQASGGWRRGHADSVAVLCGGRSRCPVGQATPTSVSTGSGLFVGPHVPRLPGWPRRTLSPQPLLSAEVT